MTDLIVFYSGRLLPYKFFGACDMDDHFEQPMQALAARTASRLGIPLDEARYRVEKLMRERWTMKSRIYEFLKKVSNVKPPDDIQLERIRNLSKKARISEAEAEAAVIVGDIELKNARKLHRLRKATLEVRVCTSLGTAEPIPKDILDFYQEENGALLSWLNSAE